jgi:hypothetical protein
VARSPGEKLKWRTDYWSENIYARDYLEDLTVDGKMDRREI